MDNEKLRALFRGNFDALRTPPSTAFLQREPPAVNGDQVLDDSAILRQSENRARNAPLKPQRRTESFSVRPNKQKSASSSNLMSWQATRGDALGLHQRGSYAGGWGPGGTEQHNTSVFERSFVPASSLGGPPAASSPNMWPPDSSSLSSKSGLYDSSLSTKSGMYDSTSRDSGLNDSPDDYPAQHIQSLQDLSRPRWDKNALYYNTYENVDQMSVTTDCSNYPGEAPSYVQSSPNLLEDGVLSVRGVDTRGQPAEQVPTPPQRDASSLKYSRQYHAKSASLPVGMSGQALALPPRVPERHQRGTSSDGLPSRSDSMQNSVIKQGQMYPSGQQSHNQLSSYGSKPHNSSGFNKSMPPPISEILPPPPTTPASPDRRSQAGTAGQRDGIVPRQYSYIVKGTKPCYNTSTQTDSLPSSPVADRVGRSDVQCGTTDSLTRPPKIVVPTEEKSIQAQSPPWSTSSGSQSEAFDEVPSSDSRTDSYRMGRPNPVRRIPETIQEDGSPQKASHPADIMTAINDSSSQTSILRKLSMEFYGTQGLYNKGTSNQRGHNRLEPQRQFSANYGPRHGHNSESRDSGFSSLDLQSQRDDDSVYKGSFSNINMSNMGLDKPATDNITSHSTSASKPEVEPNTQPPSRSNKNRMSMRKAYGTFEEVDTSSLDNMTQGTGKSQPCMYGMDHEAPKEAKDVSAKDRRKTEGGHKASKEVSGFQKLLPKKLRRVSSDNLRPQKEKARKAAKEEARERAESMPQSGHARSSSDGGRKMSDPTRHSRGSSASQDPPSPVAPNMPVSRTAPNLHDQSLSSSDSESVFRNTNLTVHSNSISALDNQVEDAVRRTQQQAVLSFYEMKTGKRSSVGSASSIVNDHRNASLETYPPVFSPAVPISEPITAQQAGQSHAQPAPQVASQNSHLRKMVKSDSALMQDKAGDVKRYSATDVMSDNHRLSVPGSVGSTTRGQHSAGSTVGTVNTGGSSGEHKQPEGDALRVRSTSSPTSHSSEGTYAEIQSPSHRSQTEEVATMPSEEETPPKLPPRNYGTQVEPQSQPWAQPLLDGFENTPKEEAYADKLRQQARRYSQPASRLQLNAAQHQYKAVTETKASISSSKPVERPNVERLQCHTPPPPQAGLQLAPNKDTVNTQPQVSDNRDNRTRPEPLPRPSMSLDLGSSVLTRGSQEADGTSRAAGRFSLDLDGDRSNRKSLDLGGVTNRPPSGSSAFNQHKRQSTGNTADLSPSHKEVKDAFNYKRRSAGDLLSPTFSVESQQAASEEGLSAAPAVPAKQVPSCNQPPGQLPPSHPTGPHAAAVQQPPLPPAGRTPAGEPGLERAPAGEPVRIQAGEPGPARVEIVEQPRKQMVIPFKVNKESSESQSAVPQVVCRPTEQQPGVTSHKGGPSQSHQSQPGPPGQSQPRQPGTFHFRPQGNRIRRWQGPQPWPGSAASAQNQPSAGSTSVSSLQNVPLENCVSVAKSQLWPSQGSQSRVDYQPPLSPKLNNTTSQQSEKMDWISSSREKIAELRRRSQECVYQNVKPTLNKDRAGQRGDAVSDPTGSPASSPKLPSRERLPSARQGASSPTIPNGRVISSKQGVRSQPARRSPPTINGATQPVPFTASNGYSSHLGSVPSTADKPDSAVASQTQHVVSRDSSVHSLEQQNRHSVDEEVNSADTSQDSVEPEVPSEVAQRALLVAREEASCQQHASLVASQIRDTDRRLSQLIAPPQEHKTTTDFMSGIFNTKVDLKRSPSILKQTQKSSKLAADGSTSPRGGSPPTRLEDRMRGTSEPENQLPNGSLEEDQSPDADTSLEEQKSELIVRLERKLKVLEEEKGLLQEEVDQNEMLGCQVTAIVERKCQTKGEFDKYRLYVDELNKVMLLLLKVSGRLARAQNALLSLPPDAEPHERSTLEAKRDEINQKHEDARQLKDGIDRRSKAVDKFLKEYLTGEEFLDYQHFIRMKSKLSMDQRQVEDKILLGQQQLQALQDSLNTSASSTEC